MSNRDNFNQMGATEPVLYNNMMGNMNGETEVDMSSYNPVYSQPYTPAPIQPTEGETEIIGVITQKDNTVVDPVVGWLVGLDGCCKGRSFMLHTGWNYIGRDEKLDVYVRDPKVTRGRTARVNYEPESRTFAVALCEGATNNVYVNKKPLYNADELKAYDVIKMGDTNLMFIPLCGEKFSWEG